MAQVNPWFKDAEEYEEHRAMIADPSLWPSEILCLKKPQAIMESHGFERSFARIMATAPLVVFDMEGKPTEYGSVEEILAAGWVVD